MKKTIIIMSIVFIIGFFIFPSSFLADSQAIYHIDGKTTVMQGETVTYNLVVVSGNSLYIDSIPFGEAIVTKDVFDFVSFNSTTELAYDE